MAEGVRVELTRGYEPSTVFETAAVARRLALPNDGPRDRSRTCTNLALDEAPLPVGLPADGAHGGIRTHTNLVLSQAPLPLGYVRERMKRAGARGGI